MRVRTNRESREAFLGCSRFPACRGTRRLATTTSAVAPAPRPRRYKLSAGGRPRSGPDYIELLVARAIGRNLGPIEGFVVQAVTILLVAAAVWALFASGLFIRIIEPVAQWYTEQAFPRPSARL
jgi:hypothetical protein